MPHKAGFVNIIGPPNAGKSTLLNQLVGEKLAIVTSRAQTTRHRLMGIVNGKNYQIIYSDTPGMIKPNYKLQEFMVKTVVSALDDADLILFITDISDSPEKQEPLVKRIRDKKIPVICALNKTDLISVEEVKNIHSVWAKIFPGQVVLPVSALYGANLPELLEKILALLPEHPPYFPKDQLTDKPERFFVEEIIREKILLHYRQEIPYSVEIVTESFKDEEKLIRISAQIFVERESQKIIIIGRKGQALKIVGTESRKDIEAFFGKKVFLELFVKVKKDWRNREKLLKSFGYR
ncbi:MAG: GTPase Era [Chlorobi bacterium]|nr:GTPase Era [Chlorobiota bacterium]